MNILRRSFFVAAFAFSLCAWADPQYYVIWGPNGYSYTYYYSPINAFNPDLTLFGFPSGSILDPALNVFDPSGVDPLGVFFADDPFSEDWELSPSDYVPSNPAYVDPIAPASDPLANSSGGGSSGGGSGGGSSGGGEGGFDPVGFFGALPSMMSCLASVAVGLFAIASGILLTFLVFRKVRYSSKRI